MATNTGKDYRQGSVRDREQFYNPKTKLWSKIDTITGKILDTKMDGTPFKGVPKNKDGRMS